MSAASDLPADPVLALLSEGRGDPRSLYYFWEQQQWEAGKLDLTDDRDQWRELDPGTRRPVADSVSWRRLRAGIATTALVPFVDVAPSEEQQVFLTTQLVDEARHLVFFDRVLAEVAGDPGPTVEDRDGIVDDAALRSLLTEVLPEVVASLRAPAAGPGELVAGVVTYHVVVLGVLSLTEQEALVGYLREENVVPGLREGLSLEARDAQRHVAFGLGLLARSIEELPDLLPAARTALGRALPLALTALSAGAGSAPTPYSGEDLEGAATSALERRCREVGLEKLLPA